MANAFAFRGKGEGGARKEACPEKARRRGKRRLRRAKRGQWGCLQTLDFLFHQLETKNENQIAENFARIKFFSARAKITLFASALNLRVSASAGEAVRFYNGCAPNDRTARAEPSTLDFLFHQLETKSENQIINRAREITLFRSAPLFGNPLPYGRGERRH